MNVVLNVKASISFDDHCITEEYCAILRKGGAVCKTSNMLIRFVVFDAQCDVIYLLCQYLCAEQGL